MPGNITIFTAQYLIYIDAVLAATLVALVLYGRPRTVAIRWAITIATTLLIAYICALIGASVFHDPRPFTQDHVRPLIAHGPDNGFPSDHGLLAAALVAAVLLLDLRFVVIFVVLGVLVDWARVGAGIHHVIDVVGSAAFVALGLAVGYAVAPFLLRHVLPYMPNRLLKEENSTPGGARSTG